MFVLLVQDLHWANTEGLKLVYENDLSWIHCISSFLMCLKTIKISKTLDEIANTQCGPEIFCISEVITNIPWYHFSQIDIFRGIQKISVNVSSETSFTRSNGSFIWSRDRFFRHRAFLSFKRSYRFFGAIKTIGSFKLNDRIVLNAPIIFLEHLKRSDRLN